MALLTSKSTNRRREFVPATLLVIPRKPMLMWAEWEGLTGFESPRCLSRCPATDILAAAQRAGELVYAVKARLKTNLVQAIKKALEGRDFVLSILRGMSLDCWRSCTEDVCEE
jgi:hypothetical protein